MRISPATLSGLKFIVLIFPLIIGVSLLSVIYPSYFWVTFFLILLTILIWKKPIFGIGLIILVPSLGQLQRFKLASLGGGIMLLDLIILGVLGITMIRYLMVPKEFAKLRINYLGWLIIIFLIIALFTLFWGSMGYDLKIFIKGFLYWGRLALYSSLYFLLPLVVVRSSDIRRVFDFFLLTGVIIALFGFIQLYFFANFFELRLYEMGWDPHINRLTSTWLDPNFVGGFFVCGITVFSALFLAKRRYTYLFGVILMLLALSFTFSRSSYLSLVVGLLFLALLKNWRLLIVFLICGLLMFSSSVRIQERVENGIMSFRAVFTESSLSLDPTAKLRLKSWKQGVMIWQDNLVWGVGYNYLRQEKFKRGWATYDKHSASGFDSSILTILATMGVVGGGIFAYILYLISNLFWQLYRKKNSFKSYLGAAGLACLLALLIHSIFVNTLLYPFMMVYIVILVSLSQRIFEVEDWRNLTLPKVR